MTYEELDRAVYAMMNTQDVHVFRAALENGIEPSAVTPEQRAKAKNDNFRLLYSNGGKTPRPEKLL